MTHSSNANDAGSITQVMGIEVGHFTDARRPTGCTVIIARDGAAGGAVARLVDGAEVVFSGSVITRMSP